jgi:saccharopine dehydrogenase (NAD+, L-lysine-forming)
MIYGAYGFTGALAAELAAQEGDAPLLAGRRAEPLRALGDRLDLPVQPLDLESPKALRAALEQVDLVLHCAGPFSATSRPMVDACLATGTHYVDVTGEIAVFEAVFRRHAEAQEAGVVLLPGAGFDVVPSDCLAASLAAAMPDAVELELAFVTHGGRLSPGTAKTSLEGLPKGGAVRRDGRITPVPAAHKTKEVPFRGGVRHTVAIPWGDVSTAYRSTRIPNITVYMGVPRRAVSALRALRPFAGLLGSPWAQRLGRRLIDRYVEGPDAAERARAQVELWGRVRGRDGRSLDGTLVVPEGYAFTAAAALACVERILAGEVGPGAWTPSQAFGPDFVTCLPGADLRVPPPAQSAAPPGAEATPATEARPT